MTGFRRSVEWCAAREGLLVDVCACGKQQAHGLTTPGVGRQIQRSASRLIKGVHHGTCGQQILDDAVVPRGSSSVKRGHSQQINSINIGSKLFNKQLASTDLKVGRGRPVQRRLTKLRRVKTSGGRTTLSRALTAMSNFSMHFSTLCMSASMAAICSFMVLCSSSILMDLHSCPLVDTITARMGSPPSRKRATACEKAFS
mmetsp:Transcript_47869/g.112553  ORF Transcript_47869/g.112553 Transcript_47869/m.112553 type:complete len:200 (+) Transcript_47869:661-1260(+)